MLDQGEAIPSERHLQLVIDKMLSGRVVPFLGAGVNLCNRPDGFTWKSGEQEYLPSGRELAQELAREFGYPDLAKVCQAPPGLSLIWRASPSMEISPRVKGSFTTGCGASSSRSSTARACILFWPPCPLRTLSRHAPRTGTS